ncbi:MAG: cytochrome c biogenesis protein CcsA [Deltaproteobacteria bacterium]|nr:cytochrome c biogenesis protein CcsA [Deltaproteobacteria bacterium]
MLLIHTSTQRRLWASIGLSLCFVGLGLHSAGLAVRWLESYHLGIGHAPLSNFYESLVFFAWAIMLIYLILTRRQVRNTVGVFVMPFSFLLMAYASFSPAIDSQIKPLIPALKSNWLITHVITCFLGYAGFFMASCFGTFYLYKERNGSDASQIGIRLYQSIAVGFILFTIGIITGSVWAHMAWGRYWGWDPKETWALITWLIYAACLHVRLKHQVVNRRMAVISIIGLASVLFTYFGVNYLPGLHSYF